jgi:hypothetical protein
MTTMKKLMLLAITALVMVGCGNNMALESLDIVNGTKYVVTLKSKKPKEFTYNLIKVDGMDWYDYSYSDTANYNVGDTLILNIKKVSNK